MNDVVSKLCTTFFYVLAALTKWKTTEQIYDQSSISFKKTTMSLTKASLTYTSYILMGIGTAIFILLFIIVIQLCKRSKSARMSNSDKRTYDASNELRELHVRNMKPSNKGKFNQPTEAEYYQIDEQCEMEHSPAVLRISQKYKRPCLPQKPEHLCTPLAPKDNYQCHPLNVMFADNLQEASDKNDSDLYLQPFFVQENIHTCN